MKILVLNNYSVSSVKTEIKNRNKPSHHLFGLIELELMGYEIVSYELNKHSVLSKIGNFFAKIPFCNVGDWSVQLRAIRNAKCFDLILALSQDVTGILGILSYFNLLNVPVVAIYHHPILKGRLSLLRTYTMKAMINGHSRIITLSQAVALQLTLLSSQKKITPVLWGPNVDYYTSFLNKSIQTIKRDIVSMGRTGRDFQTLIDAFENTIFVLEIYCHITIKSSLRIPNAQNIRVYGLPNKESLSYKEIIPIVESSRIVAIPLYSDDSLCGLTELTDAIAIGKPVLITKNKYIDIDPEINQFGFWINCMDPIDWKKKASLLLKEEGLQKQYGSNAKEFALQKANINQFAAEVNKFLLEIR